MPTVAGDIRVPWRPVKRGCELRLAVPGETTACVSVPEKAPSAGFLFELFERKLPMEGKMNALLKTAAEPDAMTGMSPQYRLVMIVMCDRKTPIVI